MADRIEINTGILQSDIQELENHLSSLTSKLNNMYEQVEELNTLWKGQANAAFNTQFQNDYAFMQSVISDLEKYKNSLSQAKNKYDSCERTVQGVVSALRI